MRPTHLFLGAKYRPAAADYRGRACVESLRVEADYERRFHITQKGFAAPILGGAARGAPCQRGGRERRQSAKIDPQLATH